MPTERPLLPTAWRMLPAVGHFLLGLGLASLVQAMPPELARALEHFRADPPPGWSYTQSTTAEGRSTVERHDARQPEFARWSLQQTDGRPASAEEIAAYRERRSRRTRAQPPPQITEQLDADSVRPAGETATSATFHARLRPGEAGDRTASALRVTLVVHRPTGTLSSIELANEAPFSPTFAVRIEEMRTVLTFSPPTADRPLLPERVTTRVRGRAFLLKSLDADLTVAFSEFEAVRR